MFSKPFIAAYVGFAKCFDVGAVLKRQALLFRVFQVNRSRWEAVC